MPVEGLVGVKAISAGYTNSLALMKNGTVMAWGYNVDGALGNGTFNLEATDNVPVQVTVPTSTLGVRTPLTGVKAIAAGSDYSLALMDSGTVMGWGLNQSGSLGTGTLGPDTCHALCSLNPVQVHGLSSVKSIATGTADAYALLKNGTVMAWGQNSDGELGNGTAVESDVPVKVSNLSGVKAVSGGYFSALVLLKNGTVMAWGQDGYGLGGGSEVPVKVSGLSGVKAVSDGYENGMALLKDGTVMGWGVDSDDVLGSNGDILDTAVPIKVVGLSGVKAIANNGAFALALLKGGTVKAWGSNALGELGTGSDTVPAESAAPLVVSGLSHIRHISAAVTIAGDGDGFSVVTR